MKSSQFGYFGHFWEFFAKIGGKIHVYLLNNMFNEERLLFLHCTYEEQFVFKMVVMEEHTMLLDNNQK